MSYVSYEDPIPTSDMEGLIQLAKALDLPITIGEFIFSPYDDAKYISREAGDERNKVHRSVCDTRAPYRPEFKPDDSRHPRPQFYRLRRLADFVLDSAVDPRDGLRPEVLQ